uniref:Uncharacterized protein n=1 Tax=Sciurus vulgaris TaxID=55149 RepID=A0A8D2AHE6_SCIVU
HDPKRKRENPYSRWHHISFTLWDTRATPPSPGCPVLCVVGECEDPRMQCSWPKGPLLAIGF